MTETPAPDRQLPRLRIDRDGTWLDGDAPVTHQGVLANLRCGLRRDAEGYFIQTGIRIPVEVEDTPVVVTRIERRGDALHAFFNDDTDADVDPATLRIDAANVPYCAVAGRGFDARLSLAAAFQLLALAEYDESTGRGTLHLGAREYPLRRSP